CLPESQRVAIGVAEPRAARRTDLRDVIRRDERTFGVVDECDAPGLEVLHRGLDVRDLEVAERVLRGGPRALEDREFADLPAPEACRGWVLPQERQPERLAVKGLRPFQ